MTVPHAGVRAVQRADGRRGPALRVPRVRAGQDGQGALRRPSREAREGRRRAAAVRARGRRCACPRGHPMRHARARGICVSTSARPRADVHAACGPRPARHMAVPMRRNKISDFIEERVHALLGRKRMEAAALEGRRLADVPECARARDARIACPWGPPIRHMHFPIRHAQVPAGARAARREHDEDAAGEGGHDDAVRGSRCTCATHAYPHARARRYAFPVWAAHATCAYPNARCGGTRGTLQSSICAPRRSSCSRCARMAMCIRGCGRMHI